MEKYWEEKTFSNQVLVGERLSDFEFVECQFENCELENCVIEYCKFTDCSFKECRIVEPKTDHTVMMDSHFYQCQLVGINWGTLVGGGYMMPLEEIQDSQMKYNNFVELNLVKFDFSGNTIVSSLFGECNLRGSRFGDCVLDQTEFFKCDLSSADFRKATGYNIDLETNKLKKARFSFPEVTRLLDGLGILID